MLAVEVQPQLVTILMTDWHHFWDQDPETKEMVYKHTTIAFETSDKRSYQAVVTRDFIHLPHIGWACQVTRNFIAMSSFIHSSLIWPLAPPRIRRVDPRVPRHSMYIKQPRKVYYDPLNLSYKISRSFLAEADICQSLSRHPHPNLATYLGA